MCCNRDQDFQAKIFLDPCVDNHNWYPIFCLTKAGVSATADSLSLLFPQQKFCPKAHNHKEAENLQQSFSSRRCTHQRAQEVALTATAGV